MTRLALACSTALFLALPGFGQVEVPHYLKASNTGNGNRFGQAVAISADTLVVGAPWERGASTTINGDQTQYGWTSGAVYVFVRSGSSWVQQAYIKASNPMTFRFGASVAIDGDTLVVGAPNEFETLDPLSNTGAVYVFERVGTTWTESAVLFGSNTDWGDLIGTSVAIDGDTIVAGARGEDSNATGVDGDGTDDSAGDAGAAYVFVRDGAGWTEQAYLKASNTDPNDYFGWSVAVHADTVVVGAILERSNGNPADNSVNGSGAAYVFVRSGTTWSQQGYLKAPTPGLFHSAGQSVGLHGDTILVGTPQAQLDRGAVHVFERTGATWTHASELTRSNADAGHRFGESVAISSDQLVVGAPIAGGDLGGAAYFFRRTGSAWAETNYLRSTTPGSSDYFGVSVAIHDGSVAVGANAEDSAATGVDGDPLDDSTNLAGAAYAFELGSLPTGCVGEAPVQMTEHASSSTPFSMSCPTPSQGCAPGIDPVIILGQCSAFPIPIPPPLGCADCSLIVNPALRTVSSPLVVGAGLPIGLEICVQCGCIWSPPSGLCVTLSQGLRFVVGP